VEKGMGGIICVEGVEGWRLRVQEGFGGGLVAGGWRDLKIEEDG
jgi:hypothetical protein